MSRHSSLLLARVLGWGLGLLLLAAIVVPLVALALSSSPADLAAGVRHPLFAPALALSGRTTLLSLLIVVVAGTPLGWWLAVGPRQLTRVVEIVVVLPIVIPPAVLGVALLQAFGRSGLIGPLLASLDLQVPFTTTAVVLTQVVVSAPFYVASAAIAFRRVDIDLVLVARTLGASPASAFFRVAVPVAATGLLGGAALAYARAIGEFGATLLFAGNLSGTTQTMPLAIYMALESDVRAALAISLLLTVIAVALLFAIRLGPRVFASVVLGRDAMDSEGHDR
jgi:molybdate transport system permease protein